MIIEIGRFLLISGLIYVGITAVLGKSRREPGVLCRLPAAGAGIEKGDFVTAVPAPPTPEG